MTFSQTLFKLRKDHNYTQAQVAGYLSEHGAPLTHKAVSKWENGSTTPDARQFLLLCELYGIRDVLAVFCNAKATDALAALNAEGKRRVAEYTALLSTNKAFSSRQAVVPQHPIRTIPLYHMPVSAGSGQFLDNDAYELIEADSTVPPDATFAVRISGDSMIPRFVNNQVVYVKQQPTLEENETGIFMLNGDAYCKKLIGNSLVSLNTSYKPIAITPDDDLRIYGKVLG